MAKLASKCPGALVVAATLLFLARNAGAKETAESQIDPSIASYTAVAGVSGNLSSIGSDTLNNLMTLWAEEFKKFYPNVNIQIEGKGSSTAPLALIEGTAQIAPMSRAMKAKEIDAFEERYTYKPTEVHVAIDALAIYVHKDNPLRGLTMQQVDSIFSATRRRDGPNLTEWSQLGLDAWKGRAISLFGRNSATGTYGYFQEFALAKGDFKNSVKEQPGSSAVVQGVGEDLYAIGYSGIGYRTSNVRHLPLAADEATGYFPATYQNCLSGEYPLARFLTIYVNKKPSQPLDLLTLEFIKFILSRQGQLVVEKDGYYPMPAVLAAGIVEKLSR